MGISLPYARYQNDAALAGFYTTLLERARAVPGVVRVGLASHLPLDPGNSSSGLVFEGREASAQEPEADHRVVSAGTFETLGVTLTKGRGFLDTDGAESPRVIIVNEAFGRRFFPETDPLGRRVRFSGPPAENPWREIVGVVRDFRHEIARDPRPETYIPYTQGVEGTLFLVARAQADARGLANPLRDAVKSIDPNQPVWAVRTLDEIRTRSMAGFRALVGFIGAFSTVAMFLSAVGIFGVVSFLVSSRTQEIGLRMALGAREGDVVRLVMAQSSASLAAGLSVGAAGAVLTTRLLASAFTEMRAADPWSVMPSAALLASVAAFAVWLPARRAASVAPTDALRAD